MFDSAPHQISRLGIACVPEGRGIVLREALNKFARTLSHRKGAKSAKGFLNKNSCFSLRPLRLCGECLLNQRLLSSTVAREPGRRGARGSSGHQAWTLERVLSTFPRLAERLNFGGGRLVRRRTADAHQRPCAHDESCFGYFRRGNRRRGAADRARRDERRSPRAPGNLASTSWGLNAIRFRARTSARV